MKKMFLFLTLIVSCCMVQAAEVNTNITKITRNPLRYYMMRSRLREARMDVLGLKSTKTVNGRVMQEGKTSKKTLMGASKSSSPRIILGNTKNSDGWEYTITTNDLGQITKYATKGSNTVTFIWNNFVVPMRYRVKFMSLDEEQKSLIMGYVDDLTPWTEKDPVAPYIDPKKVEEKKTDSNTTDEIRETQTRW